MRKLIVLLVTALVVSLAPLAPSQAAPEATNGFDLAAFADPPADSRPTVLWFWNGTVTPDLVDRQLADLRARGIHEVILFPFDTTNLQPAFFSEGWFEIVGHTLREAQRTGMKVWLFNDDFFPSGRGAGLVVNGGTVGDRTYPPRPDLRPDGLSVTRRTVTGPATVQLAPPSTGLSVADGRLVVDGAQLRGATVLRTGSEWTDYTVTTRTRIENGTSGLVVRSADARNGYLVDTRADGGIDVWRQVDGAFTLLRPGTANPGFDPDAEHEISVVARGNTITPVLDGVAQPEVTDDRFPAGTAGVRAVAGQRSTHDSLTVRDATGNPLYEQPFDDDTALEDFVPQASAAGKVVAAAARPDGSTDATQVIDLTDRLADGTWSAPAGRWTVETFTATPLADENPGSFRRNYLDLLDDEAVDRYLDAVPGEYYRRFAWAFGTVIKGFWDDEPFIASAEAHFQQPPWTPSLSAQLAKHGSTPGTALSATFADLGRTGRTARGAYWRSVSDRFADAYYKRQARWMDDHGVDYISNPLYDEYGPAKQLGSTGNTLADNAWAQVPGTDVVFDHYAPGSRTMLPRYPASVAHQNGAQRVLLESFGAMGWGIDPEFMRTLLGAFAARGINLTVLHAMWTDTGNVVYPPPFQQENPWWHTAKPLTDWIGRVMQAGRGTPVAQTALVQPQRAAEQWQGTPEQTRIDAAVTAANDALEDRQVDFDLLDEGALTADPVVRQHAKVGSGRLQVGPQSYRLAVLPETPTLDLATVRTLDRFVRSGGTVVAVGTLPAEEAGGDDPALARELGQLFGAEDSVVRRGEGTAIRVPSAAGLGTAVDHAGTRAVSLSPAAPAVRAIRVRTGSDLAFLLNNESGAPVKTWATFPASGTPELLDPRTGKAEVAGTFDADAAGRTVLPLMLAPYETKVVAFRKSVRDTAHLVAGDLPVRGLRVSGDRLRGEVLATAPGETRLVGTASGDTYAGTVAVTDPLTPIALDGTWATRLERAGEQETERPLGSWTTIDPRFSGSATYRRTVRLDPADLDGRRLTLDLGSVGSVAEVTVNGTAFDPVLWRPHALDVTEALRPGDNEVVVRVSNTPANARGETKPSGLVGPVRLVPQRWVPIALDEVGGDGEIVVRLPGEVGVAPGQTVQLTVPVGRHGGRSASDVPTSATADGLTVSTDPSRLRLDRFGSVTVRITAPPETATGDRQLIVNVGGTTATATLQVRAATRFGTASASSSHIGYPVASVNDGITSSDDWGSGQGWNDATIEAFPDSVDVTFSGPAQVGGLNVHTLDSATFPASGYGIRDADAQVRVDGQWRTVASVRENTSGVWSPRFSPVIADAVRVVVLAANDGNYSRLIEVESTAS